MTPENLQSLLAVVAPRIRRAEKQLGQGKGFMLLYVTLLLVI